MGPIETKVDIPKLREAVRKVFAFKSFPRLEQEGTHRKDRQPLHLKESKAPYKTEKG